MRQFWLENSPVALRKFKTKCWPVFGPTVGVPSQEERCGHQKLCGGRKVTGELTALHAPPGEQACAVSVTVALPPWE